MTDPLRPGSIIGILGGGQLGRMSALAAAPLGYRCHVLTPEEDSPASQVTDLTTVAAYDDEEALTHFAVSVDVVTYEFENVPVATAEFLASRCPVRPGPNLLRVSQHRGSEKSFAMQNSIPVAPFYMVGDMASLRDGVDIIGLPAVLKTCRFGYDGKGQALVHELADLASAWTSLGTDDAILEAFVPFEKEVSVIVARGVDGSIAAYPVVENTHTNHILDTTTAPAAISEITADEAIQIALNLARSLDLVGLLSVEMFVLPDGSVLMNEIAPRPHNSGHWTQNGAATSQFEQFIRAVAGLPLGPVDILRPTIMTNLIGDDVDEWVDLTREHGAKLHLYGKSESRPGRKMGHVNRFTGGRN